MLHVSGYLISAFIPDYVLKEVCMTNALEKHSVYSKT